MRVVLLDGSAQIRSGGEGGRSVCVSVPEEECATIDNDENENDDDDDE